MNWTTPPQFARSFKMLLRRPMTAVTPAAFSAAPLLYLRVRIFCNRRRM